MNSSSLNAEAAPFYPPDMSVYNGYTLLMEDTPSKEQADTPSKESDTCTICGRDSTCTIDGKKYCGIYQMMHNHYKNSDTDNTYSCRRPCKYPKCRETIFSYVDESKYSDAGFYCKNHISLIDGVMLEELTLQLALEDSKSFCE